MNSVPTAAQMKKYSNYTVEIEYAEKPFQIKPSDGHLMKICARFFREPSRLRFFVRIYSGLDERELRVTERWANDLPTGGWAEFPERWFKHRHTVHGYYFWRQAAGYLLPEMDATDLELKMMLPSSIDTAVGMPQMPVV